MKKGILYFFIGFITLGFIGSFLPEEDLEKKVPVKKEVEIPMKKEILSLGNYKEKSREDKLIYIQAVFLSNKWDSETTNKYLEPYYNCMGDFAYQKDPTLTFIEVIKWCDNERARNTRSFYSHINELDIRNNGNYKSGYDENIARLKKEKLKEATKISISLEEAKLSTSKEKPTRYKTPIEALQAFGGTYDLGEISINEIVLYTQYYPSYDDYMIVEEAKRSFIDAVYLSFIHTDIDYIKVGIIPTNIDNPQETKFAFKSSIRRKDALRVAKKLLHINKMDDLLGVESINIFLNDSPSNIYNRARYNDMGTPTLNVFFEELSKVTY